jgi:NAD(P)H-dependent flavin oxidoreductase YrpB (nitropropane dioxygenase family)
VRGEPVYGPRDQVDLSAIRALGLPFWLAGSQAHPASLRDARSRGAVGVQIGTPFAFCAESGLADEIKASVLERSAAGTIALKTDPRASPTGLPFKVVALPGTVADEAVYARRGRGCDLGYLRHAYFKGDGSVGYRCPAEAEADYVRKGGEPADTADRKCLCNGLMAAIGLGQAVGAGGTEPAIVTAGEDVSELSRFFGLGQKVYEAADVLRYVLQGPVTMSAGGA